MAAVQLDNMTQREGSPYVRTKVEGASNVIQVLGRWSASENWRTCFKIQACCACAPLAFTRAEKMRQRKYVEVTSNRIEWSEPFICCCCCEFDNTNVAYFDRAYFNRPAERAGCCAPCGEPCPTCFDIGGEGFFVRDKCCDTQGAVLGGASPACCCGSNVIILGFDNSNQIIATLNKAVADARAGGYDAPSTQKMV